MSNGDDDNDDVRFCGDVGAAVANVIDDAIAVESVDDADGGADAFSLADGIAMLSAMVVVVLSALVSIVSVSFVRGRSLASVGNVIFIKISRSLRGCSCFWMEN